MNRYWAESIQIYSEANQLLAAINAPGNNVFESLDVESEKKNLSSAQATFDKLIKFIRAELKTQVPPDRLQILLQSLDELEIVKIEMVGEVKLIFFHLQNQKPELAAKHMAKMDQKYQQGNKIIARFRRDVSQIQQQILEQQKVKARIFLVYEIAIAIAMLFMVFSVTYYGHQLAIKMKLDDQAKEKSIRDLQAAESLLKEQKHQLQVTLDHLQKTQLQLIQSEKMSSLGQLVSGIAHEVNNPVNFIHANLPYIRDYSSNLLTLVRLYQEFYPHTVEEIQAHQNNIDLEFLSEDLMSIMNSMQLGTERIRQIVLSLRNFSRIDEAEYKAVDIHEGLENTLLILQHRLQVTNTRPEITVHKNYMNLPPVECYAGQINQVFLNILINAIDAIEELHKQQACKVMPQEPYHIYIATSLVDSDWLNIIIADNGIGIPESIQQRIFDPFFTTKPVGAGTGMGLSISYQIITEQHGGKLDCFSLPSQGTKFVIQIPMKKTAIAYV
ncbi:sensor histidine kinase [Nostoc sp. CENA543]|uniref:sensor histidine kinase n=1 Tax=Nostoc sp. CENA543 TaxID=1869241 RepID=UPI001CEF802E|nr:ATP-binding protein [Nostoc sp. CENA543]